MELFLYLGVDIFQGHSNIHGNEKADILAKQGASM